MGSRSYAEEEHRVLDLVDDVLGTTVERQGCPAWLIRPGRDECGDRWQAVSSIYQELTGLVLPDVMRKVERRSIDGVLTTPQGTRLVEYDEVQHFSPFRATVLDGYPKDTATAFDRERWHAESLVPRKLRGGGYAAPRPPLFPMPGGRHLQRAFRDGLADLLPAVHGWLPTLRIGQFEVATWLDAVDASARMAELLRAKDSTLLAR